ncbi:MAG: hypothetical protein K0S38_16 [Candidatus Paceibacter sp.]|nr:hypothetical protein [Candidatus Paceibacter sp.]
MPNLHTTLLFDFCNCPHEDPETGAKVPGDVLPKHDVKHGYIQVVRHGNKFFKPMFIRLTSPKTVADDVDAAIDWINANFKWIGESLPRTNRPKKLFVGKAERQKVCREIKRRLETFNTFRISVQPEQVPVDTNA